MPERRRLRVAIVGAGLMGRWHAHAAGRLGATVAAIVDADPARGRELAARHAGARSCGALGEVLGDVDVVHLCTPTPTHGALAAEAIEYRRHVLVEKPLAASADETAALLDLAAARGVHLCPVHQFPFQPGFRRAMARLETIGPVRQVSYTTCSAGAADADPSAAARIAIEILPHPLSLFVRLSPSIADVAWSVRTPMPGEIRALGQAGEAGLAITISMSGRPTTNRLEIVGARGAMRVDLFHGFAVTFDGSVSRMRKATRPWHDAALTGAAATANIARRTWDGEWAYPGLRALMREFYDAVRLGGPSPVPPAETMAVARAGDRIAAAAGARQ